MPGTSTYTNLGISHRQATPTTPTASSPRTAPEIRGDGSLPLWAANARWRTACWFRTSSGSETSRTTSAGPP